MDRSGSTAQESSRWQSAFSLVEVTICLGIASFALVVVFSLLPVGLNHFRKAMETSIGSQIAQRVISDAQQTDFDALITDFQGSPITGANATGLKPFRFFDDQGTEILPTGSAAGDPSSAPAGLTVAEKQKIVYWVNTRIMPGNPDVGVTSTQNNASLVTVTIQVAQNPGNQQLAFDSGAANDQNAPLRNLWNGAYSNAPTSKVVSIKTYSALVSRNK